MLKRHELKRAEYLFDDDLDHEEAVFIAGALSTKALVCLSLTMLGLLYALFETTIGLQPWHLLH